MKILLQPTYFPNATTLACMVQDKVVWEIQDNYQKQTYRNRCMICNDRGKQLLNIPIQHSGSKTGRQITRNVITDKSYNWQRQHWRSLETAYRAAPFFEYYEDELSNFFHQKHETLLSINLASIKLLCRLLDCSFSESFTESFELNPEDLQDARFLVSSKSGPAISLPRYAQVFEDRLGFVSDLSALDLLFNEGPQAQNYLRNLRLPWHD